jgi:hypothetical protein
MMMTMMMIKNTHFVVDKYSVSVPQLILYSNQRECISISDIHSSVHTSSILRIVPKETVLGLSPNIALYVEVLEIIFKHLKLELLS